MAPNYRVGPLGFLVPHGGDSNVGFWDAQMALQWVQNEIHHFYGDRRRVTIWGQSAGADLGLFLMVSESSRWLFQQAILMSLASLPIKNLDQAHEISQEFASRCFGAGNTQYDPTAESLREVGRLKKFRKYN